MRLQELTSRKDQHKYLAAGKSQQFIGVRQIAEAFDASPAGLARANDLASPAFPAPKAVVTGADADRAPFAIDPLVRSRYALSNLDLFKALSARDLLYTSRNAFLYM